MKKLFCLLLVMSLLAASAVGLAQTYQGDGYSFDYPDEWVQIEWPGVDALFYMPDYMSNLNVTHEDLGVAINLDMFDQLILPSVMQSYESTYENFTPREFETPVTFGENTYSGLACSVTQMGLTFYLEQYWTLVGTKAYVFTVTYAEENSAYAAFIPDILASFSAN